MAKMPQKFKRRPLDGDDIDRLVNACKTGKEKLVVLVLLDTGLRVGEFVNLKLQDIFWQRGYLVVRGKDEKQRQVPMTTRVKKLLEAHFALHNEIGMSDATAQNIIKRVAERAGIKTKVTPHVLRHTFAVQALSSGVDIRAVQEALGHSTISITEQYLYYVPERILDSFRRARWL